MNCKRCTRNCCKPGASEQGEFANSKKESFKIFRIPPCSHAHHALAHVWNTGRLTEQAPSIDGLQMMPKCYRQQQSVHAGKANFQKKLSSNFGIFALLTDKSCASAWLEYRSPHPAANKKGWTLTGAQLLPGFVHIVHVDMATVLKLKFQFFANSVSLYAEV